MLAATIISEFHGPVKTEDAVVAAGSDLFRRHLPHLTNFTAVALAASVMAKPHRILRQPHIK